MSDEQLVGVDVRTWPERTDTIVSEPSGRPIVHFPLAQADAPACNVAALRETRVVDALARAESDQTALQAWFALSRRVRLYERGERDLRIEHALARGDLRPTDVEFAGLGALLPRLLELPVQQLWAMTKLWFEVVERDIGDGGSDTMSDSWTHRAQPGRADHFLSLVHPTLDEQLDRDAAWTLFRELVLDVPLKQWSFGLLLRAVYFQRTEFTDRDFTLPPAFELLE